MANDELRMANVKHENIRNRTFRFACDVTHLVLGIKDPQIKRTLGEQLLRSAASIGANLEEADGAVSKNDFIHIVGIAKKEAREAFYWLRLLSETKIVSNGGMDRLLNEADELIRILIAIFNASRVRKQEVKT